MMRQDIKHIKTDDQAAKWPRKIVYILHLPRGNKLLVFYARNVAWKAMLLSDHVPGTSLILHFMQLFLTRFVVRRSWDGRRQSQLEELISWNAESLWFGGLPSMRHHQMRFAEERTTCLFWPWLTWAETVKIQGIQLDKEHLQVMFC